MDSTKTLANTDIILKLKAFENAACLLCDWFMGSVLRAGTNFKNSTNKMYWKPWNIITLTLPNTWAPSIMCATNIWSEARFWVVLQWKWFHPIARLSHVLFLTHSVSRKQRGRWSRQRLEFHPCSAALDCQSFMCKMTLQIIPASISILVHAGTLPPTKEQQLHLCASQ